MGLAGKKEKKRDGEIWKKDQKKFQLKLA